MNTLRHIGSALLAACLIFAPLCARSQSLTILHTFSVPISVGSGPDAPLVQGPDGNLFGVAPVGGPNNTGTIFKITPNGILTTLYIFSALQQVADHYSNADGAGPNGLALGPDGNFYGTAYTAPNRGGLYGGGTFYKISPSGAFVTLYNFIDGAGPNPVILGKDGNFYGTTQNGTIFKITPSGVLTTLYAFSPTTWNGSTYVNTDGSQPMAGLVQGTDGNFYGTTSKGGSNGAGTVFKITPSGAFTVLHSFSALSVSSTAPNADGGQPRAPLLQGQDGNFYGTAMLGGANGGGTIFKVTPSGAFSVLFSFSSPITTSPYGSYPTAPLVVGSDGALYGVTSHGGALDSYGGTIFKITTSGVFTTLFSFARYNGAEPSAALLLASDGNFYGTTQYGGFYAPNYLSPPSGTIFKITPSGSLTTLYAFGPGVNPDGAFPSYLTLASNGDFYGSTYTGGAQGQGTVYQITPQGDLTTLHSLATLEGSAPTARLTQGSNGDFYGSAPYGGEYGSGSLFQMTPDGSLTPLYSFSALTGPSVNGSGPTNADGANPNAPLVQVPDGSFFGVAPLGGANGTGTIFKISPTGSFTLLHTFSTVSNSSGVYVNSDGAGPNGLTQGTDGNFYGTTEGGGAYGLGTFFRVTPAGAFTVVTSFNLLSPIEGLALGSDGNFYGTTAPANVERGSGAMIFRITPAGNLTTLYTFNGVTDGGMADGTLVAGPDGNFYDTTGDRIFKRTPSGVFTIFASLPVRAWADLSAFGSDGALYGTGQFIDGASGLIFRIDHGTIAFQNPTTGQLSEWSLNSRYQATGVIFSRTQYPAWQVVGMGDFNDDGQPDILFQNSTTGQMAVWYLRGGSVIGGDWIVPHQNPAWKVVGVADFDGDGQPDILFQNPSTGQLAVWYMNGLTATGGAFVTPVQSPAWKAAGVADFDGDGQPDILFQNTSTGQMAIWYMNGIAATGGAFISVTPDPAWHVVGTADANWDGHPDILLFNPNTGQIAIQFMQNSTPNGRTLVSPTVPYGWQAVGAH